jgi:hypothetical protein
MFDAVFKSFRTRGKKWHVKGNRWRLPRFHDMWAPKFLTDNFLSKGPFNDKAFPDGSLYNLYIRLKFGGRVSVYTLRALTQAVGVELDHPIYGYKRIKSKVNLGREEETYTLSVDDPFHRFEADGVITKNSGADILKISLVKLVKELHRKGWLKNGGDDSVRILMTVHDEIVFEVRDDRVPEALPLLVRNMQSPSDIAKWKVPLIVEPLLGKSWAAKYDWVEIQAGKGELPEWLKPHFEAYAKSGPKPETLPPPVHAQVKAPQAVDSDSSEIPRSPLSPKPQPPRSTAKIAVFAIPRSFLTSQSIRLVRKAIAGAEPVGDEVSDKTSYKKLRLIEPGGKVLIDSSCNIWVDPDEFGRGLREYNLGLGFYDLADES